MIRPTGWLPLAALALLVALTVWLNQLVQAPTVHNDGLTRHDPDVIVENFDAQKLAEDGTVQYTLHAKKMVHYPDDDSALLDNVRLDAYEPGQPKMTMTSDRGRLEQKGERVLAEGNVVIVREADPKTEKTRITTDRLLVLPDDGIARTKSPVTVDSESSHATGTGMELNNQTRTLEIDNVHATIKPTYNKR